MNSILFVIAMAAAVQTQTPTATVSGDVVTVAADFAWIDLAVGTAIVVPVSVIDGTVLTDNTMLASTDGIKPVAWKLPPGSYKITAFGYPDNRLLPNRTKIVLDVVVLSPTRQQQIKDALRKFSISSFEVAAAKAEIKALNPTRAELAAALTP